MQTATPESLASIRVIYCAPDAKPATPAFADEELAWFRGPHREVAP